MLALRIKKPKKLQNNNFYYYYNNDNNNINEMFNSVIDLLKF